MNSNVIPVVEASRRLASAHLKRCPLCESLNAAANTECFVCSWRGMFDRDAINIEDALRRLLRRCPNFHGTKTWLDLDLRN